MPVEALAATEPGHREIADTLVQLRTKRHEFHATFRGSRINLESRPDSSTYVNRKPQPDGVVVVFGPASEMVWNYYFVVTPKHIYVLDNQVSDVLASAVAPNTFAAAIADGLRMLDKYLHNRVFGTSFPKNTRVYMGKVNSSDDSCTGVRLAAEKFVFRVKTPNEPDRNVHLTTKEVMDTLWLYGYDGFFSGLKRLVRERLAVPGAVEAAAEPQPQAKYKLDMFIWVFGTQATRITTCDNAHQQLKNLLASHKQIEVSHYLNPTKYATPSEMLVKFHVMFSNPKPDLTLLVSLLAKQDWVAGFSNNNDADDSFIKKTDAAEIRTMISDILENEMFTVIGAAEPAPYRKLPVGALRVSVQLHPLPPGPEDPARKLLEDHLRRLMHGGLVDCSWNHVQFALLVDEETKSEDLIQFIHDICSAFTDLPLRTVSDLVQKAYRKGLAKPALATAVMGTSPTGKYTLKPEQAEAAAEPHERGRVWYFLPFWVRSRDRADALEKELNRAGYETSFERLISERGVKLADIRLDILVEFNTAADIFTSLHRIAEITNRVLKPKHKVVATKEEVSKLLADYSRFSKQARGAAEPPATLLHIPDLHLLTDLDPDETGSSSLHEACDEIGEVLERYGFEGGEVAVRKIALDEGDQDYNWCLQAKNLTFTGTPVQLMHKFTEMLQYLSQHRDLGVNIKRKDIPAYVKDMHEAVLRTQHGHDSTVTVGSTARPQLLVGTRTSKKVEPMAKSTASTEPGMAPTPSIKSVSFRMLLTPGGEEKATKFVEGLLAKYRITYSKLVLKNGDVYIVDTREEGETGSDVTTFELIDVVVPGKSAAVATAFVKELSQNWQFYGSESDIRKLVTGLARHRDTVHAAAEPQPKPDPAPARKPGQPEPYVHAVDGKIRGLLQLLTKWTAAERNEVGKESLRKLLVLCKNEAWPRLAEESKKKLLDLK